MIKITKDFITEKEELELLSHIAINPLNKGQGRNSIVRYGSSLPYKSNVISNKIPHYLDLICCKIVEIGLPKPNSVTINEYKAGQGIAPHIDSTASGPIITILSLLGGATMKFDKGSNNFLVEMEPRSLLQMDGDERNSWRHSIEHVNSDRYSIVFRTSQID